WRSTGLAPGITADVSGRCWCSCSGTASSSRTGSSRTSPNRTRPRHSEGGRRAGTAPTLTTTVRCCSVERIATGAATARVRIVDRETLLFDAVDEVDRSAFHIRCAHPVDRELQAVEVLEQVSIEITLVKEQLVPETGTPTRLHGNTKVHIVAPLLLEQGLRLVGGGLAQGYAVGGCSGFGLLRGGHRSPSVLLCTS